MEHLSRRTTQTIDYLLIVSDLTIHGLKAAARISKMSNELKLVTHNTGLILNRVEESRLDETNQQINETGLDVAGHLPLDPLLAGFGFNNSSLLDISLKSKALKAVMDISMSLDL